MKVFVTGATGVMGRAAVAALVDAGHDVAGLARSEEKAEVLRSAHVEPVDANLFNADTLATAFVGYETVLNLATHIPVGYAGIRPGAWRVNDRIRTQGSRIVAEAALAAGVRRLVQESVSYIYADGGDAWLDEQSPLAVTRVTEPVAVAELNAQSFAGVGRSVVVLRFGSLIGDEGFTRWRLARARAGQPIGIGDPDGWSHVLHTDDVGDAVLASLDAPGGVYNVGAEPVSRSELASELARAAGRERSSFLPKMMVRLAGDRVEPLTRSHRISSATFMTTVGWVPRHPVFGAAWFDGISVDGS